MKTLLFILFTIPLMGMAQDSLYKIYSVTEKKEITLARMIAELKEADVVFFGEEHNDSIAHLLELEVFKGLHAQQDTPLSLSMEMFQTDVQLVLDEYLKGLITEKNLEKDGKLWNNYTADYRPLVEYAKENDLYILAANAPSRYTNRVTRHGLQSLDSLSEEARKLIAPLPIDTLSGAYYEKFAGMMGGHGGMGHLKIYQSQNVWDATMAWKIAKLAGSRTDGQILHINGKFHSDERLGTYAHLKQYAPNLKLTSISALSADDFDNPDWEEWDVLADYIILTDPKVERSFR